MMQIKLYNFFSIEARNASNVIEYRITRISSRTNSDITLDKVCNFNRKIV